MSSSIDVGVISWSSTSSSISWKEKSSGFWKNKSKGDWFPCSICSSSSITLGDPKITVSSVGRESGVVCVGSGSGSSGSTITFNGGSVKASVSDCGNSIFAWYDWKLVDATLKLDNCWFDVKYKDVKSSFIFSIVCTHPLSSNSFDWPFLIIVIGSPVLPVELQLLLFSSGISSPMLVDPNLIELPNLPSII